VKAFVYNPNVKNTLVLKGYDTIASGRLEFDASRSEAVSHGDLAWATMHALANEPLQGQAAHTQNAEHCGNLLMSKRSNRIRS